MDAVNSLSQQTSAVNLLAHTYQETLSLILSLCKKRGYCFAHNDALAQMRGKDETTITRHIARLVKDGFLRWERVGNERWLFPVKKNAYPIKSQCADSSTTKRDTKETNKQPDAPPAPKSAPVVVSDTGKLLETYSKETPLQQALQQEGINPAVSQKLARETPVARLQAILREYRRLREAGKVHSPGWIVRAVTESWQIAEAKEQGRYRAAKVQEGLRYTEMPTQTEDLIAARQSALRRRGKDFASA